MLYIPDCLMVVRRKRPARFPKFPVDDRASDYIVISHYTRKHKKTDSYQRVEGIEEEVVLAFALASILRVIIRRLQSALAKVNYCSSLPTKLHTALTSRD